MIRVFRRSISSLRPVICFESSLDLYLSGLSHPVQSYHITYLDCMSPNFDTVTVCIITCNMDCSESNLASSSLAFDFLNSHRTGTKGRSLLDLIVALISLNVALHERLIFRISRSKSLEQLPCSDSSTLPRCLRTAVN